MTQFSHLPVSTAWRYISAKKLFLFLISILLILIAGFRPVGFDRDSIGYILHLYTPINQADLKDKEPAFWLIVELNRSLFEGNERTFFLIFAILGVSLKIIAISRLSLDPILSLWIYICSYFLLHDMTQIRAGVASGIFLLSIQDMHNKNFKSFLLKVFLASMFHYSSLILIPVYFLLHVSYELYLVMPAIALAFVIFKINLIPIIQYIAHIFQSFIGYKVIVYIDLLELGMHSEINPYNLYYTLLFFLYYFMLFNMKYFKNDYDKTLLKILGIGLTSFYILYSIPVFAFRISEFLLIVNIILLPNLCYIFKQKRFVKLMIFIYAFLYAIRLYTKLINWEVLR